MNSGETRCHRLLGPGPIGRNELRNCCCRFCPSQRRSWSQLLLWLSSGHKAVVIGILSSPEIRTCVWFGHIAKQLPILLPRTRSISSTHRPAAAFGMPERRWHIRALDPQCCWVPMKLFVLCSEIHDAVNGDDPAADREHIPVYNV